MTMHVEGRAWPIGKDETDLGLRYSASGNAWLKFKVAQYTGKTQDGEPRPKVYWTVTCFGDMAERVAESLEPGDEVIVIGQARANNWETNEGQKRYDIEINAYTVALSLRWNAARAIRTEGSSAQPQPSGGWGNSVPAPQGRENYGEGEAPF